MWRQGAASDNPSSSQTWARDHVDWAGLPINLDMAFSRKQRDKVYMQHLMRKRGAQLSRWLPGTARLCVVRGRRGTPRHGHGQRLRPLVRRRQLDAVSPVARCRLAYMATSGSATTDIRQIARHRMAAARGREHRSHRRRVGFAGTRATYHQLFHWGAKELTQRASRRWCRPRRSGVPH